MLLSKSQRCLTSAFLAIAALLVLSTAAPAQTTRTTKKPTKSSAKTAEKPSGKGPVIAFQQSPPSALFDAAKAHAKDANRPLIVFGMAPSCAYCAALKQALATQPDLQQLMPQYVPLEVPFGSSDFVSIWDEASRQNISYAGSIGSPAVFIFTAAGDVVFAGPKSTGGLPQGDAFKMLLIQGIEKNGGLRSAAQSPPLPNLVADTRKLLSEGKSLAAAALLSTYASSKSKNDDLADLVRLTGLKPAKSKDEELLDSLVTQLSEKGQSLLEASIASATTADATTAAVQLAEIDRAFTSYPGFADKLDAAWKDLLTKSQIPNLKEQAELIDKARQLEAAPDPAEAIAAYERVLTSFPDTKAAELSQLRITQLQSPKATPRTWKSKSGQFSVTATLVSFDGKSAQLRTDQGKTVTVPLDALSPEDQQFLKTNLR